MEKVLIECLEKEQNQEAINVILKSSKLQEEMKRVGVPLEQFISLVTKIHELGHETDSKKK